MLYHKLFHSGEEMYLFFPGKNQRTPFKRSGLFVLMDEVDESSVRNMLEKMGLARLAMDGEIVLAFPVPKAGSWKQTSTAEFDVFYNGISKPDDEPLPTNSIGIPTFEAMAETWHPMNDVRYVMGFGTGASYALRLAAEKPAMFAGILADGATAEDAVAPTAPMAIWFSHCAKEVIDPFLKVNEADLHERQTHLCSRNPAQAVVTEDLALTEASLRRVWFELFRKVRRINTCVEGDLTDRMEEPRQLFRCFVDDDRLDGRPHTWFVHVPEGLGESDRVPLVMFFHGGSDNPAEAAEMVRLHELGQTEKFITVYPWGSNRCSWNTNMQPDLDDDVTYIAALIRHMLRCYPLDSGRVYLSGFSNGAAMAHITAMCYPDLVTAIFPIDANWPGLRGCLFDLDWRDVIPMARGMKRKEETDYIVPVWYTYGSREPSYPVRRRSTQQYQYDYWKMYNRLSITPTPEDGDTVSCGCGAVGDLQETLRPCTRYPNHWYEIQRFANKDGEYLYNYVVMHDKGHEVAPMDAALGWQFVSQFRRTPDGQIKKNNP